MFLWKEGDPVQVVKNLHLPRFTLEKFLTDYCNSKTNTGKEENTFQVKPKKGRREFLDRHTNNVLAISRIFFL